MKTIMLMTNVIAHRPLENSKQRCRWECERSKRNNGLGDSQTVVVTAQATRPAPDQESDGGLSRWAIGILNVADDELTPLRILIASSIYICLDTVTEWIARVCRTITTFEPLVNIVVVLLSLCNSDTGGIGKELDELISVIVDEFLASGKVAFIECYRALIRNREGRWVTGVA